ncbi:MAG: response regulator [Planctomycetes bacterium]|nr:response regulator [Planctomycetota bacterium]
MSEPLNILVVNVRPDAVRALGELLHQRGHRVATAGSALEAVARAQRLSAGGDRFTLMMAELDLPDMDGLELLAELRRRGETGEFALLTGSDGLPIDQSSRARHLGCDQVLKRPYSASTLDQLLETAIGRRDGRIAPPGNEDPAPFFGTTRVFRASRLRAASEQQQPPPRQPTPPPMQVPAPRLDAVAPELFDDEHLPHQLPEAAPKPTPPPQRSNGATRVIRSPLPTEQPPGTGILRRSATPPPQSSVANPPGTGTYRSTTGRVQRSDSGALTRPGGYERQRSDPFISARPRPAETTARIRRSVDGGRPDTGAHVAPPPQAAAGNVTCPLCGKAFQAAIRTIAFTTLCVHCGQLVRIEPG